MHVENHVYANESRQTFILDVCQLLSPATFIVIQLYTIVLYSYEEPRYWLINNVIKLEIFVGFCLRYDNIQNGTKN